MDIAHSYYKQIPHHNLKICFELVNPEEPTILDLLLYSWGSNPLGSLKREYNKKRKNI